MKQIMKPLSAILVAAVLMFGTAYSAGACESSVGMMRTPNEVIFYGTCLDHLVELVRTPWLEQLLELEKELLLLKQQFALEGGNSTLAEQIAEYTLRSVNIREQFALAEEEIRTSVLDVAKELELCMDDFFFVFRQNSEVIGGMEITASFGCEPNTHSLVFVLFEVISNGPCAVFCSSTVSRSAYQCQNCPFFTLTETTTGFLHVWQRRPAWQGGQLILITYCANCDWRL